MESVNTVLKQQILQPKWPLNGVGAFCTKKKFPGDFSGDPEFEDISIPIDGLNLEPKWLTQVHGNTVVDLDKVPLYVNADASFTTKKGVVCVVRTADCVPILMASEDNSCVAAVHGGWKGLAKNIIKSTLEVFPSNKNKVWAWIGPCIRQDAFEVKEDFLISLQELGHNQNIITPLLKEQKNKYYFDLVGFTKVLLLKEGIDANKIVDSGVCTFSSPDTFFSYRHSSGKDKGRIASMIYIK